MGKEEGFFTVPHVRPRAIYSLADCLPPEQERLQDTRAMAISTSSRTRDHMAFSSKPEELLSRKFPTSYQMPTETTSKKSVFRSTISEHFLTAPHKPPFLSRSAVGTAQKIKQTLGIMGDFTIRDRETQAFVISCVVFTP